MNYKSILNNFLFWQPRKDLFKKTTQHKYGNHFLIVINYTIWFFLFFVSYLLIKQDTNIFWQLLFATIIGEIIEKILKIKSFWKRPLHLNNNTLPNGLLKSWYQKGSFPSGHTIKAVFFFILLLQTQIFITPFLFLVIVIPLLLIRVFLGLHYPIDVVGGAIIGFIIGILFLQIQFPLFLINFIQPVFNFIFFIKLNMFKDLSFIFSWWITIFSLSLLSLPIIFHIFSKFWDHGYIFAKTLSLIVITYLILIFGIFKILPFNTIGLSVIIFILLVFNVLFLINQKRYLWFFKIIKSKYRLFLAQEIIFLIILTAWSYIRGFAPNIEGLEKYMDWGFVNSALRSNFLPPQDMWFSGEIINYYYFGHLIFALITKISQISSSITYNLSIATVCALTFVSTFCLSSNLVYLSLKKRASFKYVIAGLISAFLLTFGGNLHSVYKIAQLNYSQNNNKIVWTKTAIQKATSSYWYPDSTRFIGHDPDTKDKTIHEFPLYSFVVADLHGHMNDIIIVIFFMAFLLASFLQSKVKFDWQFIIFSGFILSLCYMTNAWDFAIYGLLLAIFTIFINFYKHGSDSLLPTIFSGLLIILFWYLFSLPFSLKFIPMMEGIKISDAHTPFYQLFVLYGGFWIICLPFIFYLIYLFFRRLKTQPLKFKLSSSDIFIATIIITATILIFIPELVYIKDIYIYEHRRANTMFKLVYQSFILYSLCSGYVLVRLPEILKSKILINLYKISFAVIFIVHMIYPYFAIKSYYGELKLYHGLDGLTYLKDLYPDNYKAILWINKNISNQPVMLEAVGDSYTTFNQVSSATGLPTVQGWVVHEWLWRGGYDAPAARQADVEKIYLSKDLEETKTLLSQYQVKYIFVGDKEYEKYSELNPQKFKDIGAKIVFQSGKTAIYQL